MVTWEQWTSSTLHSDDQTWTIRYIVAETGNWLAGRKVLISLVAFGKPELESRTFSVTLTRAQVRNSLNIDTQRPIYRWLRNTA